MQHLTNKTVVSFIQNTYQPKGVNVVGKNSTAKTPVVNTKPKNAALTPTLNIS